MQTQVGQECCLIDVGSDLLSAALRGDVLCLRQLRSPTRAAAVTGKSDEILGDHWYGASRALLPWCVSR
jgi:hypothetical protein